MSHFFFSSHQQNMILLFNLKNVHGELLDIGSIFHTDQQAFLGHLKTQLSKMLNTLNEKAWVSETHKKKCDNTASSHDET